MRRLHTQVAVKLKGNGFPQESTGDEFPSTYYENGGTKIRYRHIENDEGVKIPTLSELIEACGEVGLTLIDLGGKWKASKW